MSTSGQSKVSVRQALRDRCLTVASPSDATAVVRHLDPKYGGVVVSSSAGFSRGTRSSECFPAWSLPQTIESAVRKNGRQRQRSQ